MYTVLNEQRTNVQQSNENISVPIGTIRFVKEYLRKLGIGPVFARIKRKGVPLLPLIESLISYRLSENFSIEGYGRWLECSVIRNELGVGSEVSHRMLNRTVDAVGENMETVITTTVRSVMTRYDISNTD